MRKIYMTPVAIKIFIMKSKVVLSYWLFSFLLHHHVSTWRKRSNLMRYFSLPNQGKLRKINLPATLIWTVFLYIHAVIQPGNHAAAGQCITLCRYRPRAYIIVKFQIEGKCGLRCWICLWHSCWCRMGRYFRNTVPLGFYGLWCLYRILKKKINKQHLFGPKGYSNSNYYFLQLWWTDTPDPVAFTAQLNKLISS